MTIRRTARLVLRPWTGDDEDRAFLFDMYARPEVHRYLGRVPRPMVSPDEVTAMLERWEGLADGVLGVRALTTLDGRRLGSILLKHIPWSADAAESARGETPDVEIGWHLHPDAWGHGYATEGATAVLAEAHAAGITRVVAVTNPANAASQRVCLRLGMRAAGETARYYDTVCRLFVSTSTPVASGPA